MWSRRLGFCRRRAGRRPAGPGIRNQEPNPVPANYEMEWPSEVVLTEMDMELQEGDDQTHAGEQDICYSGAVKLAIELSRAEHQGATQTNRRYDQHGSGFFDNISDIQQQAKGNKAPNDKVSMRTILDTFEQCRNDISDGLGGHSVYMRHATGEETGKEIKDTMSISLNKITDLVETLFGNEERRQVPSSLARKWCKQGFTFHEDPRIFWAMTQRHSETSGVIAAVQAYVIECVLFHNVIHVGVEHLCQSEQAEETLMRLSEVYHNFVTLDHPDFPEGRCRADAFIKHNASEALHIPVLIEALCVVLYNATPNSKYTVLLFEPLNTHSVGSAIHSILYNSTYIMKQFNSIADVAKHLMENMRLLTGDMGVLSFTLSVLATRGIENIQADMDDPLHPMVGRDGQASMELVNLMIHGRALSDVIDAGDVARGATGAERRRTKGVSKPCAVGFLTEAEAMMQCKVGPYLKNPIFPVWVTSSCSNYSVLFGIDRHYCKRPEREIYEENLMEVWERIDQENKKFVPGKTLARLLHTLSIHQLYTDASRNVVTDSGIILCDTFKRWYIDRTCPEDTSDESVELFQYIGHDSATPLAKVSVKRMSETELALISEPMEQPEASKIDVNLPGHIEGDFSIQHAMTVWTRWPRTLVSTSPVQTIGNAE